MQNIYNKYIHFQLCLEKVNIEIYLQTTQYLKLILMLLQKQQTNEVFLSL